MYHDAYQIYELLDKWSHRGPPSLEETRQLFAERPEEAKRLFWNGQTLLHKAVDAYPLEVDFLSVLITAFPEALSTQDESGDLPMHLLLSSSQWKKFQDVKEMIQMCLMEYPEAIVHQNSKGQLPLHLACNRTKSAELVKFLMDCFPDSCHYKDGDGKFPLNIALDVVDPEVDVLQMLINKQPVLLSMADEHGCLPVHKMLHRAGNSEKACYSRIIEVVLNGFEGSLRIQDGDKMTPLMLACTADSHLSIVYSLVRKWPEQITMNRAPTIFTDSFNGELLYSSLASNSRITVVEVQQWIRRNPNLLLSADSHGRIPIHYAVLSQSKEAFDIAQFLLANHQEEQLRKEDVDGRLPLHIASACWWVSHDILQLLIDAYPAGLLHKDKDGRLPWHYGEFSRQDLVYEASNQLYPEEMSNVDLDLVPPEIRWDILSIADDSF